MNNSSTENIGYLVVRVSTARGAIPLENATVSVRGTSAQSSDIIYSLETDESGLTPRLPLPAPPKSNSLSPDQSTPYSLWSIDVFKKGYVTARYESVPVYPEITSVQNAELIPLSEGFMPYETVNQNEAPNL
jgi:hypothetical protein